MSARISGFRPRLFQKRPARVAVPSAPAAVTARQRCPIAIVVMSVPRSCRLMNHGAPSAASHQRRSTRMRYVPVGPPNGVASASSMRVVVVLKRTRIWAENFRFCSYAVLDIMPLQCCAVSFAQGLSAGVVLPAPDDDFGEARVQFHRAAAAAQQLTGHQRRAGAAEPGSSTSPLAGDELATIRSMSATGFVVGCRSDLAGLGTEMIELASSRWTRLPHAAGRASVNHELPAAVGHRR